jgi:pyrrolysine biosynthesis protein PylC
VRVLIIGGKLQGIEAAYLARQAGWQVWLVDKNFNVPAKGLTDSFLQADITANAPALGHIFQGVDLIIPALENRDALISLKDLADRFHIPLAFDAEAYSVTSSKKASDCLFRKLGLPSPQYWPECAFPLIMKPSGLSGSQGVRKVRDEDELAVLLEKEAFSEGEWVIQEYLEGPSYSLEVFGFNGNFWPLQTTVIEVDRTYDCKRVLAPAGLPESLQNEFAGTAVSVAKALNLKGIMDLEVILNDGDLKLLEIDARLPSQTPTAVLKSTGINMLELLYRIFVEGKAPDVRICAPERSVILEHIRVTPHSLEVCGEHIMAGARALRHEKNFFGADEALTDYGSSAPPWVVTLIISGEDDREVILKRRRAIDNIRAEMGLVQNLENSLER